MAPYVKEFESEALGLLIMSYAAANCSVFRCALKVVMVAEIFVTRDREFQTAGAVIRNALD